MASASQPLARTRAPNPFAHIALHLVLLSGFYCVSLTVVAVLVVVPLIAFAGLHGFVLFAVFGICWTAAVSLLVGMIDVKPVPFVPPGRELSREEAPELLAIIDALARRAGTAPPAAVYLSALPNVSVTATGGFFGIGAKRVLCLGVPVVEMLTARQLEAVLAHELGHFLGGDTRVAGVVTYTRAAFRSVMASGERAPFREGTQHWAIEAGLELSKALAAALVAVYAKIFFRVTHGVGRRQELAADALSAELVGSAVASAALERVAVSASLYDSYLGTEVAFAMQNGAMPADLVDGFEHFSAQVLGSPGGARFVEEIRTEQTDPYDTHPSLRERLDALAALDLAGQDDDARPATALLVDAPAVRAWLVDASVRLFQISRYPQVLPWEEIATRVYDPALREQSRKMAHRLYPAFPGATTLTAMFVAVVRAFEQNDLFRVASVVEPALPHVPPHEQAQAVPAIAEAVIATLLQGALLESGGHVEVALGSPSVAIRFEDEPVSAALLAADAMRDPTARAAMVEWAARLEAAHLEIPRRTDNPESPASA